jgi:ribosome-associated protein
MRMALERLPDEATPLDLARRIVDIAADRQAVDIILLDIRAVAAFSDYFVICGGTSDRHIKAIVDNVMETLDHDGFSPTHVEGNSSSGWVLADFNSVILHVFAPAEREYYRLERLWAEGTTIVRIT